MTYQDAVLQVQGLRERFDSPFSSSDKDMIAELYWQVLHKEFHPTTCQQCYHDALIEVYLYLKNEKTMKKKCDYRLRAGFIIACPEFRNGKIFTNENLTNEVAKEYLAKYPLQEKYFSVIPEAENAEGEEYEKPTKKK